jgi:hypothetical protein
MDFFKKEGAYFRRRSAIMGAPVEEIWTGEQWEPYKGDRIALVNYGDKITQEDLPPLAREDD